MFGKFKTIITPPFSEYNALVEVEPHELRWVQLPRLPQVLQDQERAQQPPAPAQTLNAAFTEFSSQFREIPG